MNIDSVVTIKPNPNIPQLLPGDTVKVSAKIVEGDKERIQVFQGVVIKIRRGGVGASFTVRRIAYGVGVERTFPFYSPMIEKVDVVRHGKVRRAKLYYLRGLSGKASRIKEKRIERIRIEGEEQPIEQLAEPPSEQPPEQPVESAMEQPVAEKTEPPVEQKTEPPAAQQTEQPAAQKVEPAAEEKKE